MRIVLLLLTAGAYAQAPRTPIDTIVGLMRNARGAKCLSIHNAGIAPPMNDPARIELMVTNQMARMEGRIGDLVSRRRVFVWGLAVFMAASLLTALAPLHRAAGIDRMVVSTYQAVSGAGQAGMDELDEQWLARATDLAPLRRAAAVDGTITPGKVWGAPIAGNAIPLAGSVREAGYTSEEWKLVRETHKILHDDAIRVTATCVRVPVYVGHSMTANVQFRSPMDAARAASLLAGAPGVRLVDGGAGAPTALEGAGIDPVLVGRLRDDPTQADTIDLWVTGDNLRKGAALNSIQMAEILIAQA